MALLALAPPLAAQNGSSAPSSLLDGHVRAAALIDAAVAAHGGIDALRQARRMRVVLEGRDVHRNQSRRVAPPYDTTSRRSELMIDLSRGQVVSREARGYPGGFRYNTGFTTSGTRDFFIDTRKGLFADAEYPPADQQFGQLLTLPQWYLLVAHELAPTGSRRWLGRQRLTSGTIVDAVSVPIPSGGLLTLGFDTATHRLRAVSSVGTDIFTGDTQVDTEFLDYRMLGTVLLPTRRVLWRGGEVVRDETYVEATPGYAVPDSLLSPPSRYTPAPAPRTDPVRELAPGVWAIRAGNVWSLLVAFADHLLVVDAAPSAAPEVIARAATLAPGKPIRWVVPTHHHDDHFPGVRTYAAAGARTVTTAGNAEYFRRIVSAPPSSVQRNPPPPTPDAPLEILSGTRRIFSDTVRTVEIHDIGPNPHADEILVAWLPAEGILFQADLVEVPATGVESSGANAAATIAFADWLRRQHWKVRVIGGAHAFLASPAELDRIVRQPILAPW